MRARRAFAWVALACWSGACTHDFDVFESGDADGAVNANADAGDAGGDAGSGSDAGAPDVATRDSATRPCSENDAKELDGHCYFLTSQRNSWDDASAACRAAGAHLATVSRAEEQSLIDAIAPNQRSLDWASPPPRLRPRRHVLHLGHRRGTHLGPLGAVGAQWVGRMRPGDEPCPMGRRTLRPNISRALRTRIGICERKQG